MTFNFVEKVMCIGGNGTEVPALQFYKKGFKIGSGSVTPTWQDIVLSGNTSLTLANAKANGLNYVKLFGACEQESTTNYYNINVTGNINNNNGVLSGFGPNIYASTNKNINYTSTPWLIQIGLNYKSASNTQWIMSPNQTRGYGDILLGLSNIGTLMLWLGSNNSSWDICNGQTGATALVNDNYYLIRLEFTGTDYILSHSEDGINFINDVVVSSSTPIYQGLGLTLGVERYNSSNTNYLRGSINLKDCYINANGERWWNGVTKVTGKIYNITEVGNVANTNGILSGFTSTDYAIVNKTFPSSSSMDYEFVIPAKLNSFLQRDQLIMCSNEYGAGFGVTSAGKLILWLSNVNWPSSWATANGRTSSLTINTGTKYYFKMRQKSGWFSLLVSTDNVNYTEYIHLSLTDRLVDCNFKFGISRSNNPNSTLTDGEIYLNESYIKVADEIWWEGATEITTPTPENPLDIICNNGVVKVHNKSGLPLDYQAVEYLGSTGTQYIDTGIIGRNGLDIYVKFQAIQPGQARMMACSTGSIRLGLLLSSNTGVIANQYYTTNKSLTDYVCDNKTVYTLENDDGKLYFNGVLVDETTPATFSVNKNLYLFASNSTNVTTGYVRIFEAFIKENGVLLLNCIPCRRKSDNELGMYDTVTGNFLTNSGTGTFIAGADVDDIEIYTDGTTETVTVNTTVNSATAEMLLSVGDYKDVQEVLSGAVTRNVGIKVLDGTEDWVKTSSSRRYCSLDKTEFPNVITSPSDVICSHAIGTGYTEQGYCFLGNSYFNFNYKNSTDDLEDFKQYLATQYANGTPVIIVYPLATATTETVTPQPLSIQAGTNTVEITQASIDNLGLEVSYKATV